MKIDEIWNYVLQVERGLDEASLKLQQLEPNLDRAEPEATPKDSDGGLGPPHTSWDDVGNRLINEGLHLTALQLFSELKSKENTTMDTDLVSEASTLNIRSDSLPFPEVESTVNVQDEQRINVVEDKIAVLESKLGSIERIVRNLRDDLSKWSRKTEPDLNLPTEDEEWHQFGSRSRKSSNQSPVRNQENKDGTNQGWDENGKTGQEHRRSVIAGPYGLDNFSEASDLLILVDKSTQTVAVESSSCGTQVSRIHRLLQTQCNDGFKQKSDKLIVECNSSKYARCTLLKPTFTVRTSNSEHEIVNLDIEERGTALYAAVAEKEKTPLADFMASNFIIKMEYKVLRPEDPLTFMLNRKRESLFVVPAIEEWYYGDFVKLQFMGQPQNKEPRSPSERILDTVQNPACLLRDLKRGKFRKF